MANMSYCRFENTYHDLEDCYQAMGNDMGDLSETEKRYFKKMLALCKDIVADFGEEEDED